ncbi:MAG: exosome complex RNA-binding protein Csl4 [Candidatus Methanofastidiosia archaeon]
MKDEGLKSGDFVIPGDVLGVGEVFMPGEGTYEDEGIIYSNVTGVVDLDMNKRKASVEAKSNVPPVLIEGDPVICEIVDLRSQMALVDLIAKCGHEDRALTMSPKGRIYISQSSKHYVTNLQNEFRIGDLVRARVRDGRKSPIELSTIGDDMGVILALCTKCRTAMKKKDGKLECPKCGSIESRNMSQDYGKGNL